jgi:hypothetical protein
MNDLIFPDFVNSLTSELSIIEITMSLFGVLAKSYSLTGLSSLVWILSGKSDAKVHIVKF